MNAGVSYFVDGYPPSRFHETMPRVGDTLNGWSRARTSLTEFLAPAETVTR